MKKIRSQQGQSTVEYVIVFTAIAAAIIFAAISVIKPAVNQTYNQAGESITKAGNFLSKGIGFGFHNAL